MSKEWPVIEKAPARWVSSSIRRKNAKRSGSVPSTNPRALALRAFSGLGRRFAIIHSLHLGRLHFDASLDLGQAEGGIALFQLALSEKLLDALNTGKHRPLTDQGASAAQTGMDGHG